MTKNVYLKKKYINIHFKDLYSSVRVRVRLKVQFCKENRKTNSL